MNQLNFLDMPTTHFAEIEIVLRLVLAVLFGAAVGFERELKERPAGLRTHMLVALASALFTIVAFEIFYAVRALDNNANIDPLRLIEAITAGVAFLAAGSILRSGRGVKGLTTGAGMWMAGALGMASGAGYYSIAIFGTLLTLTILILMRVVEAHLLTTKEPRKGDDAIDE